MTTYIFDTSFIIAHKVTDLPKNFRLSGVVVAELMASANDDSQRKAYEAMRLAHERDGTLIVPTADDWLMAGRVLYWLTKRRKKKAGGKLPPLTPGASQRMMLDVLIAVSARRVGATIVTDNWDDFKAIQYYCKIKLRRGSTFS